MAEYTLRREQRALHVLLHADLTAAVVPALKAALQAELKAETEEVVFDLAAARMIDSTGIGLLIAATNSLAGRKGQVRVRNASPELARLFRSMRLTHRIDVQARTPEPAHG